MQREEVQFSRDSRKTLLENAQGGEQSARKRSTERKKPHSPNETTNPYAAANLPPSGYQHIQLQCSDDSIKRGRTFIYGLHHVWFQTIFKKHIKVDGEEEVTPIADPNRKQCLGESEVFIPRVKNSTWFKELERRLQHQLNIIQEGLKVVYWAVLFSKGGGEEQAMHKDFEIENTWARYAGIISLDDNGLLVVEKRNSKNDKRVVKVRTGEAIIFRGNFLHAGAAYAKNQRRLYFKAIPEGKELLKEEQDNVIYAFVWCKKRFPTYKILENNKYYFVACHGEELVKKKRERAKEVSARNKKVKMEMKGEEKTDETEESI